MDGSFYLCRSVSRAKRNSVNLSLYLAGKLQQLQLPRLPPGADDDNRQDGLPDRTNRTHFGNAGLLDGFSTSRPQATCNPRTEHRLSRSCRLGLLSRPGFLGIVMK